MGQAPTIWWVRRDLRLADNPALASVEGPVLPLFICDDQVTGLGAAAAWRLDAGLRALQARLAAQEMPLILRRGPALEVLPALVAETGAAGVVWNRLYDPDAVARDREVKAALKAADVPVRSFNGALLFEPWEVETGQGGYYKVYSPYWRAVKGRDVAPPVAAPALEAPGTLPPSDRLDDWRLGAAMRRGADVVARHALVGEAAAADRLEAFLDRLDRYKPDRDRLDLQVTSGLSEPLAVGEISARQIWAAGLRLWHEGRAGAEKFLQELVWREFAYHLMWHTPHMLTRSWREGWDAFPWARGPSGALTAWQQGRTGEPVVDAAMREMYVTGKMHNRARMIVASYLTKHLLIDWREGQQWFADCLTDWDAASNAMGWQWVAGSGPDAAPYFRIFNPATQAEKFDPDGTYRARWIAEGTAKPHADGLSYFDAVPRAWGLSADQPYPDKPVIGLKEGRERALEAYQRAREG